MSDWESGRAGTNNDRSFAKLKEVLTVTCRDDYLESVEKKQQVIGDVAELLDAALSFEPGETVETTLGDVDVKEHWKGGIAVSQHDKRIGLTVYDEEQAKDRLEDVVTRLVETHNARFRRKLVEE